MGLAESWRAWRAGESSDEIFGKLYLSQEEIDAQSTADSKLDQLNRAQFDAGKLSEQEYLDRAGRIASGSLREQLTNPDTSILKGFNDGLEEGRKSVQEAIKKTIAAPLNFTFSAIPWQVWVLAMVAGAWYLGLFGLLKRKVSS